MHAYGLGSFASELTALARKQIVEEQLVHTASALVFKELHKVLSELVLVFFGLVYLLLEQLGCFHFLKKANCLNNK